MKENDINLNCLLHIAGKSRDKILNKRMPTIIGISDKRLFKIDPKVFLSYK